MDTILEFLSQRGESLLGRLTGPLNFRLVVMPLVVTILAIRAHIKDVREGRPTTLFVFIRNPAEWRQLMRSALLKDYGKVFIVACVLDTAYQILFLHSFYPAEVLVVAVMCAVVPYLLVRGPILRGARLLCQKWAGRAAQPVVNPNKDTKGRPASPPRSAN
jgi:hypothetical protein